MLMLCVAHTVSVGGGWGGQGGNAAVGSNRRMHNGRLEGQTWRALGALGRAPLPILNPLPTLLKPCSKAVQDRLAQAQGDKRLGRPSCLAPRRQRRRL